MTTFSTHSWGCCASGSNEDEHYAICISCDKPFHRACLSLSLDDNDPNTLSDWKCPICSNLVPKSVKNDSTPIRNNPAVRQNKRPSLCSPSPPTPDTHIIGEEVRSFDREVIRTELADMINQLNQSVGATLNSELVTIRNEIKEVADSTGLVNDRFVEIEAEQVANKITIKNLQEENTRLKDTVTEFGTHINFLEQYTRSNNIEVQCVPENKQENLHGIVKKLSETVGAELEESDIVNCTRIAKNSSPSVRPRFILVQLSTRRVRDQFLASCYKYNKKNPQNKLSSVHLGIVGSKTPVYVVEHLSPANKSLHAAVRLRAKNKGYKYVWVRNGKIFVRKSDDSDYILIKNIDNLNKII